MRSAASRAVPNSNTMLVSVLTSSSVIGGPPGGQWLVGRLRVEPPEADEHAVELVFVAQYHLAVFVLFLEFKQALQQELELHNVPQVGRVLARRSGGRRAEAEAVQRRERRRGSGGSGDWRCMRARVCCWRECS